MRPADGLRSPHRLQFLVRETNRQTRSHSDAREAHRSRPRRRPRPREGLLLGIRAGIVSVCPSRIAPRVCGVGDAFRAHPRRRQTQAESFRPWAVLFSQFVAFNHTRIAVSPFRPLRRFAHSPIRRLAPCAGPYLPVCWWFLCPLEGSSSSQNWEQHYHWRSQ